MLKRLTISFIAALCLAVASSGVGPTPAALAACSSPATTYGTDTVTYAIPTAGTYRIWTRIQAPDTVNNSYFLQVDGGCAINVGDASITPGSLVWVDYQDGVASTKITMSLAAGNHTFVLTGREPDVIVDRVVFASDQNCVPTGTGDNCAIAVAATPTPTTSPVPTAAATPTPTPAPTYNAADLNHDGHVNVFDLSILLNNWGKAGAGDLDNNGVVNIFDLSRLLAAWTN
jgi:hypothetical protein